MALPPRSLACVRPVRLESVDAQRRRVTVGERPLARTFGCEQEAREAGLAEVVRLDALALALLRRIRSRSRQKR